MEIRRVAVIYDDRDRPETTAFTAAAPSKGWLSVAHFRPDELADIPRDGFDLFLNIDDGLEYRLPDELRPSAWWAIDTHLNFDWCREKAQGFDFVFAAQRDGADRLAAARNRLCFVAALGLRSRDPRQARRGKAI